MWTKRQKNWVSSTWQSAVRPGNGAGGRCRHFLRKRPSIFRSSGGCIKKLLKKTGKQILIRFALPFFITVPGRSAASSRQSRPLLNTSRSAAQPHSSCCLSGSSVKLRIDISKINRADACRAKPAQNIVCRFHPSARSAACQRSRQLVNPAIAVLVIFCQVSKSIAACRTKTAHSRH